MTEVTRERQPSAGGYAERRPEPRPSSAAGRLHRTPRVRPQSRRVSRGAPDRHAAGERRQAACAEA